MTNSQKVAERFLRLIGLLLVLLGVVHLIATPHIPGLLNGSRVAYISRLSDRRF